MCSFSVAEMCSHTQTMLTSRYMETVDEFDPKVDFPRHMEMSDRCVQWGEVSEPRKVLYFPRCSYRDICDTILADDVDGALCV